MNEPYTKIRVLVVDDHEMVREGLRVILKKIPELELVGEASNGEEALRYIRQLAPDVILTDVKMPRMDGIEFTRLVKKDWSHIGVVALSSFDEESLILDMLRAGAKGYILKNASKQELKESVEAAYRDEPYYSRNINLKLANMIARGGFILKNPYEELFSEREREVIQGIYEGLSSKQIADRLGLKPRTVERYRDGIMKKMEVRNAAGVVRYAVDHDLVKDPK